MGCGMHVVLTVLTLGLWIPFGMMLSGLGSIGQTLAPYRCQVCGKKN